jgi:hypothetical protein
LFFLPLITQVIIGTHGRMKNWVSKRQLDIDHICILVFDEADEMLKADAFADDTGACVLGGEGGRDRADAYIYAHPHTLGRQTACFRHWMQLCWWYLTPLRLLCPCLLLCCATRTPCTVRLIKTIRRKNPEVQLLLFSATYNDKVKEFAMRIAPNANQVRVLLR